MDKKVVLWEHPSVHYTDYIDSIKYFISTIKNKKMKPFDLAKALNGERIVTRNGHEVSEILKFKISNPFCVFGVVNGCVECWDENGKYGQFNRQEYNLDLFMAPVKRQEWRGIYKSNTEKSGYRVGNYGFDTEQEAFDGRINAMNPESFIKAVLIREWEE